jgi:hypothetical protein
VGERMKEDKFINIIITWNNGKKESLKILMNKKEFNELKNQLIRSFHTTILSVGDDNYYVYSLKYARKVDIYE